MIDVMQTALASIITSVFTSVLVYFITRGMNKRMEARENEVSRKLAEQQCEIEDTSKKQTSIESGMRSMLRYNLIQSYDKANDRGYIPPYEREGILSNYHDYKVLGGNGAVDHLMDEMADLPSVKPNKRRATAKPQEAL
jgi:hypothetical protein